MTIDIFGQQIPDRDPQETAEWLEALGAVIEESPARARFLMHQLIREARNRSIGLPSLVSTPYINTIPPEQEPEFPGDEDVERRIRRIIRWNAVLIITRGNKHSPNIGGHISTYASAASLYEVGFNHFFRGKDHEGGGDLVYFQGHAAPGIYARAFLEGRLSEEQLDHFRRELGGNGLSSYPHPRFKRYLHHRGIADTSKSKVWCFVGDGETDEPETLGSLSLAAREQLDNLIWVVNCNLQRLDGPVRGNGKIIQELEAIFRGAGWNVIKVIWGSKWDELLMQDRDGVLLNKMNTTVDGDFQRYAVEKGAYIREHFFGPDPRLRKMVEHLSDDELRTLPRGGHDYRKLYSAYKAATEQTGAPTVILAKTIKGWTLGPDVEGRNATHQIKKMTVDQLRVLRERLYLHDVIPEDALADDREPPYIRFPEGSVEQSYLMDRRKALDGPLPSRVVQTKRPIEMPEDKPFAEVLAGSGKQEVSTTMAFTRLLRNLCRDPKLGPRVVPIIPDEARTFGMDALFKEFKIYAAQGQAYVPVDAQLLLSYSEAKDGQILEEGITEAGSMASFIAAATSYAHRGVPLLPFFTFYSMFGFQRVGDLIWSANDSRARGFLLGATAGRTTLLGEGLQHQDGHSLILASAHPTVEAWDPAFAYEMATIVRHGIREMLVDERDVIHYLTLYNENYVMPPMPDGVEDGIIQGLYRWSDAPEGPSHHATILFSGTAQGAARAAQAELAERWDVGAELWSATSYKRLREEALSTERLNRLHPTEAPRTPLVSRLLGSAEGPVVAVTDFMKAVPDQVARWVHPPFVPLGTDGFGRSYTREQLREFFEIDMPHVVVATLWGLAQQGEVKAETVADAIAHHGIDPGRTDPRAFDL